MLRLLREALIIVLIGIPIGLAVNAISPKGITLQRNYFPDSAVIAPTPDAEANGDGEVSRSETESESLPQAVEDRLGEKGLQLASHDRVVELFQDPRYEQGLTVFVDARDHAHFQEGHIPGAYQFDHYRMDEYVGEVLPICEIAEQIVVYCTGGNCEDSEFAAIDLVELGVPNDKVAVYVGGISEWKDRGMPVEQGPRLSGNILGENDR